MNLKKIDPAYIRRARRRLGLSEAQLAEMLGCVPQQLRRLQMHPGASSARKISRSVARLLIAYAEDGYRPDDWPKAGRYAQGSKH